MYSSALWLHSWLRWAVLVTGLIAWVRSAAGAKGAWSAKDELWSLIFISAVDLQILAGLILYVALSPFTRIAFQDFGGAMTNASLRYWAVEHLTGMVIAVALAHVGRVKIRRAADAARKHRLAVIFYGLSLVVMIASIPWPGLAIGRPLFRG